MDRPEGSRQRAGAGNASDPRRGLDERLARITEENQRLFRELLDGERRFRHLARSVYRVQEDERRRLARELHDGIGQVLTALKNRLDSLADEVERGRIELREGVSTAAELAAQALSETRELSRLLRPPVLDDLGLEAALRWLARTLGEGAGLAVELQVERLDGRLDADTETLCFRVVQEALTNVMKHAGVRRAQVTLRRRGARLWLRIHDGGRGFDPAALLEGGIEDGCGLRRMRDRVELLFGGRLRVESRLGGGTTVTVELPVARAGGGRPA